MKKTYLLLMFTALFMACSSDDSSEEVQIPENDIETNDDINGIYIMCEGNWGSNNAAIDYLNFKTSEYTQNIFSKVNSDVIMGLGDTSSDMQVNGDQLWVVVNGSNKVEVLSKETCKRIKKIDIPNCRYVTFHNNHAYVSSYVGPMGADNIQLGTVFKIDVNTLEKVDSLVVSYQPEEMAVVDDVLYVACSGGYRYPIYDRVVSTINLKDFKRGNDIDVELNLHRVRKDSHDNLWITSRGNYEDVSPALFCYNKDKSGNMTLTKKIDIAVSDMCIVGDSLYYFGVEWSNETMSNNVSYGIINTETLEKVETTIFSNDAFKQVEVPYGIIVSPDSRDIFITDAKNYVSSGKLYHFDANGTLKNSVWTSDIPSKMIFN